MDLNARLLCALLCGHLVYAQETLKSAVNGVAVVLESLDRNAELAAAAADAQGTEKQIHPLLHSSVGCLHRACLPF